LTAHTPHLLTCANYRFAYNGSEMPTHISEERKTAYYVGLGMQILGGLLFASVFVTMNEFCAAGGVALIFIGGIVCRIGARGLAGSGLVLDPGKARDELEPYSRMAGGMVKDAIDEANIGVAGEPNKVIMIKCQSCGGLNPEAAKFCQECGTKL
jgi:hypothetical protein